MSSYTISSEFDKSRMFVLQKSEINKRLDPFYYSPLNKLAILENTKLPKKRLSEVAELKRGKFSHRPRNDERFFGGKYPFIQTGEIVKASNNLGKIEYTQTLNELGLSVSKLFDEEVLLITIAANIGDTAILDYPACFPDSVVAISSKDKNVSLKYLNVYFKFLKKYLENLAPSAAQKNLTLEQLAPTPVVLPTLTNQNIIVQIFDNYIEQKQKNEAEAEKLLASIDDYLLKEVGITLSEPPENTLKSRMFTANINAITGSRFDPFFHQKRFDALKKPVSKYPTKRIKEINEEIKTGLPVRKDYRIEDGAYPYYGANGIIGYMDEYTHDGLYLVIGQDGYIGNHYVVEGKFWGSNHNWVLKLKSGYDYEYVKASLDVLKYDYLITGGVIPKLTKEALESIRIPIPPLDKQKEIAKHITDIRQQAQQLKDKTKELLKKASEEIEEILLN